MLQGKCVDIGGSTNLVKGEVYYLFPHGGQAYCASRFPQSGSHFGAYQKNHFELVDVAIDVSAQVLNKYFARVVKPPSHFYRIDEEYIITEQRADGYYSVFFKHRPDGPPIGAYKRIDFFERIEPFRASEAVMMHDIPKLEQKTADLVYDKPEIVNAPHKSQKYEQLTLFLE